jgi:hypothetical protein
VLRRETTPSLTTIFRECRRANDSRRNRYRLQAQENSRELALLAQCDDAAFGIQLRLESRRNRATDVKKHTGLRQRARFALSF